MNMSNNLSPRYDSVQNPAYHIDCTTASSGKLISVTKRRVRWRFGFSNRDAIKNGSTGPECRGEEHEVSLIWSLASGKRMVLFDGEEVHFSVGKISQNKFEFDWTMRGNHVIKIIAYATLPLRATTNFRQFDLLLDGRSVFDLPRIFELGSGSNAVVPHKGTYERYNEYVNYHLPQAEEMAWAQTMHKHEERRMIDRSASLQAPACAHPPPKLSQSLPPNMDFAMPGDLISEPTPVAEDQDFVSSPLPILEQNKLDALHYSSPALNYSPSATQTTSYEEVSSKIMDSYDSPSPQIPSNDNCTEPSGAIVASTTEGQSLNNYGFESKLNEQYSPSCIIGATNHGSAFFSQPVTPEPKCYYNADWACNQSDPRDMAPETALTETSSFSGRPSVCSSPSDDSLDNDSNKENGILCSPDDELGLSIKKLVNIDDIRSLPEEEMLAKLSTKPYEKPKLQHETSGMSRGLPPTPTAWHMRQNSTLSQIQSTKPQKAPTVQVMNSYTSSQGAAASVAEGQMVVYGAHSPLTSGPPPISRVMGFGVGTQVTYDDYSTNQQCMPTYAAY